MKSDGFPYLRVAGRILVVLFIGLLVWGLMACGGSSSNGNGEDTELRAFVFGPDTAEEAAFLAADSIMTFLTVNEIMKAVIELGESEEDTAVLTDEFCDGEGSAVLTVPPLGPGVDALLEFTACGDDALTGMVYFRVKSYEADAPPPSPAPPPPFLSLVVDLEVTGEEAGIPSQTRAEFAAEAFRDAGSATFRYFEDEFESYWFMKEGAQETKRGCFDLSIRETDDAVSLIGFRSVFVDAEKRLFSVFRLFGDLLRFQDGLVVGGDGFPFLSQAAVGQGRDGCAVVGAPEGITPGRTSMNLETDPDVVDGIVLSGTIKTTWRAILAD
jgi:hypothetical protein